MTVEKSGVSNHSAHEGADSFPAHPVWRAIREHLESERRRINGEVHNYPPPIPACDAQFNHLLEEQSRISRELARLDAACREGLAPGAHDRAAAEFMSASNYIDEEAGRKILSNGGKR